MTAIKLVSHSLTNVSAVTVSAIDADISERIAREGDIVTLQRVALATAAGNDYMYRTVLAVAAMRGLLSIPAKENGKFDGTHDAVKLVLSAVSADSTNSVRKYAGEVVRLAWTVKSAGYDPFVAPNVSALRIMARPVKDAEIATDEARINQSAIEAIKVKLEAEKTAKIEAEKTAKIEAEKTAKLEAKERAAIEAMHKAETARDAAITELAKLRSAVQTALYGTTEARKTLRAEYPKV